jgi:hypothetical protein
LPYPDAWHTAAWGTDAIKRPSTVLFSEFHCSIEGQRLSPGITLHELDPLDPMLWVS